MQYLEANLNNFKIHRENFRSHLSQKIINNKSVLVFNSNNLTSLEQYIQGINSTLNFIATKYLNIALQQVIASDIIDLLERLNKKDAIDKLFSKDPSGNYVFIDLSNIYFEDSILIYSQYSMPTISFSNSIFANDVTFQGAFAGNSYFINTTFKQKANFQSSVFLQKADFSNSKIDLGFFDSARFDRAIKFDNTCFNHLPHFNDTNFQNKKEVSFSNIKYGKEAEKDNLGVCLLYKNELRKLDDYVEENKVFAIEQKIRLNKDIENFWISKNWTLVPNIFISAIYRLMSNYGQATLKPILLWFGLLFYCGFLFNFFHLVEPNPSIQEYWGTRVFNDTELGYLYSFQNISNPLSVFSTDVPFYPYNTSAAVIAHLEAILSVIIITLWVFALKRRFQKGE